MGLGLGLRVELGSFRALIGLALGLGSGLGSVWGHACLLSSQIF